MSWSLCKRGLELLEEGNEQDLKNYETKTIANEKAKRRQGKINKEIKYSSNKFQKNALELYEKNCCKDRTEKNLKVLQKTDGKLESETNSLKVRTHHEKQLERKRPIVEKSSKRNKRIRKKDSGTAISEEEFESMNEKWLALM